MALVSITEWKAKALTLREIAVAMAESKERRAIIAAAKECDRLVIELKRRWKLH